jgi:glycine/serine hydroxymethyltransferase
MMDGHPAATQEMADPFEFADIVTTTTHESLLDLVPV